MVQVHRNNDLRECGATTIASQSRVTVAGEAIATVGDINSHGAGAFIENGRNVSILGKKVIGVGDSAEADSLGHTVSETDAATGHSSVFIG